MTYNKPEVTKLDGALSAIQGTQPSGKPGVLYFDHLRNMPNASATITAYEADE